METVMRLRRLQNLIRFAVARGASLVFGSLLASMLTLGCSDAYRASVGSIPEVYHRIYITDFNTAWQSALDSLKSVKIDVNNREGGFLQTKWTDNTLEKNFSEQGAFMKAQYRFLISVAKTFYNGRPCVKVTVQKEQMIQRDVLEGWRPLDSDSIEEKTLLYRIGRLIYIRTKLAQIEEEKNRRAIEQSGF